MNKKGLFIVIITVLCIKNANSQNLDNWIGSYSGMVNSIQLSGEKSQFSMKIDVVKVNDHIYDWTITYGDSGTDVRPYQLVHDQGNKYVMDEKNGIVLQMTKFENEFTSIFEVMESFIYVRYKLVEDGMEVIISSGYGREESGGSMDEDGNVIPNVGSYVMVGNQNAFLTKSD